MNLFIIDTEAAISESKAKDWERLGNQIEKVSLTPESKDLFRRIIDRDLQG